MFSENQENKKTFIIQNWMYEATYQFTQKLSKDHNA